MALVPSITALQEGPAQSRIRMWLMLPVTTPPLSPERFRCQGRSSGVRVNVTPSGLVQWVNVTAETERRRRA